MSATLPGREALPSSFGPNWWVRAAREVGWGYLFGGLVASLATAVSGSALLVGYDGSAVKWWFGLDIPPGGGQVGNYLLSYAGVLGLSVAWFGILRRIRASTSLGCGELVAVGALWALPLLLGPPLFSRDIYSYLAQGMLAHLQLSPYTYSPALLGLTGLGKLVAAVSPVWRLTTAPYGPVFVWVASAVAGLAGTNVDAGVLALRLPELLGTALVAGALPRLARRLGGDPREALWLGALSPLVMFELVSSGHNDALMVGLLMLGLLLAVERMPLLGVAACCLGTLVKLPALIGAAFIAWAWAREQPRAWAKFGALAAAASVGVGTLAGGSAASAGFGWISTQLLSVPSKVAVPASPSGALSGALELASQGTGLGLSASLISGVVRGTCLFVGAALLLAILGRCRLADLVPSVGAAMVVAALLGTDAWPWYLTWGAALLAAWRPAQRSWMLVAAAGLFDLLVTPAGQVVVPDAAAPVALAAWAALAVGFWVSVGRTSIWPMLKGSGSPRGAFLMVNLETSGELASRAQEGVLMTSATVGGNEVRLAEVEGGPREEILQP
jgi:alpha-1,6-mannosyltransferase